MTTTNYVVSSSLGQWYTAGDFTGSGVGITFENSQDFKILTAGVYYIAYEAVQSSGDAGMSNIGVAKGGTLVSSYAIVGGQAYFTVQTLAVNDLITFWFFGTNWPNHAVGVTATVTIFSLF
jgi:hypothetical protein